MTHAATTITAPNRVRSSRRPTRRIQLALTTASFPLHLGAEDAPKGKAFPPGHHETSPGGGEGGMGWRHHGHEG